MRHSLNLLKFNIKKFFNNTKITDNDLNYYYHLIKKDNLIIHNNSPFNKKSIKIKKNILYFNHFFETHHMQVKLDLTNKRKSVLRVKRIENDQINTIINKEINETKEVISFIKKLS